MRTDTAPHSHLITIPADFPVRFYIRTRPPKRGPYVPAPHIHNCLEVGYCHEGAGVFVIADKILPFRSRDVVVVNSSEPHFGQNRPGIESVWTWIYFDPARLLGACCADLDILKTSDLCGTDFKNILSPEEYPGLDSLAELIIEEEVARRPHYRTALCGYLTSLLTLLHRVPGRSKGTGTPPIAQESSQRLGPALAYVHAHYTDKITLELLAKQCFMSTSHFRKLFKQVLGKTPYQFILSYRISMAMSELREGAKTCSTIAMSHGFPSLSSFTRKFKDATGMSPRIWAKR
jgi:AraC-like DNA-binding protein